MLVDRDNILDIIKKYQEEMDDLERELKKTTNLPHGRRTDHRDGI